MSATILSFPRVEQTSEQSDEALLRACAHRDPQALGELFQRHHRDVYRFASRMIGRERHLVDDLVQTTFIEAWTCAKSYKGKASVRAWLLGIAANLAKNQLRKSERRARALILLRNEEERHRPLDEIVASKQLVERIGAALEKLPHHLKVAYVMCELEEIPGVDAARALGVRPGTMWRRLHQARRRLRDLIEEQP